jgi:F420H(2)-dependent quinone reductase
MTNRNDYNRQVIEEFRANGGKVSGPYEHTPLLLLTTTGAKSGIGCGPRPWNGIPFSPSTRRRHPASFR